MNTRIRIMNIRLSEKISRQPGYAEAIGISASTQLKKSESDIRPEGRSSTGNYNSES